MTAKKMIELIQQHHPHISETEALLLLNQAKDDFCQDTEIVKVQSTFTTTANQLLYSIPSGVNHITDGSFNDATKWVAGTGWTVNDSSSGVAAATAGSASTLVQSSDNIAYPLIPGAVYMLKYKLTRTAGTIYPLLLNGHSGMTRNSSGRYTEHIVAGNGTIPIQFVKDNVFAGSIDSVSLYKVYDVLKIIDVWIGDLGSEIKAPRLQGVLNIKDSV